MDRTGEEPITPEGFRRLEHPSIFIAGSGDIIETREVVESALDEALNELGSREKFRCFSWDVDVGTDGFSQARSMQKNLPRPSDPECRGLVCVIGERIGLPLETDFDVKLISGVEKWLEADSRFRLAAVYPEELEERLKILEAGQYPLTGTSFEVLDALGAGKPVLLILLADDAIKPEGPEVVLNNNNYFLRRTKDLAPLSPDYDKERQLYQEQVRGVHNFFCGLGKVGGLKQHRTRNTEKVRELVKQFVAEEVLWDEPTNENPYKFLNYFDVGEGDSFFGRDDFVAQAVEDLECRWTSAGEEPAVLRIEGPSGCGKSSVLRAGILGNFLGSKRRGRYACVAFRPEDFNDSTGRPMPVIETLLYLIEEKTDLIITLKMLRGIRREGANAPAAAVALLGEILRSEGKRLILGIDQFEEILDVLANGVHDDMWLPLVSFINLAAKESQIGVVYTLESSRLEAHESENLGPAFINAGVHKLDDESEIFLRNIIRKPFKQRGVPLDNKDVDTLIDNLKGIRDADDRRGHYGVLPLLSLKLSLLFDELREQRLQSSSADVKDSFGGGGKEAVKLDLGFEDIFEKQAQEALTRAGLAIDEDSLDHFFQPLVAVEDDRIQLTAVSETRPYADEQRLAAAFLDARLLTRVGTARIRLVHEAVIRRWSKARQWFEERSGYLKMEAGIRVEADYWDKTKRPAITGEAASPENVDRAAQILQTFIRAWSMKPEAVGEDNRRLRDYCIEVFSCSETPMEAIPYLPSRQGVHVSLAAAYGLTDVLRNFKRIDPDCFGKPNPFSDRRNMPLGSAAWAHLDTVTYLLSAGTEPVARDGFGWPAIAAAIQSGGQKIFRTIIEACRLAHPEAKMEEVLSCPEGQTLLHVAAFSNQPEIAKILIDDYDFDPRKFSGAGEIPIHVAAKQGADAVFEMFRKDTQLLTVANDRKFSCIHLAAYNGEERILDQILGTKGADELAALSPDGWTALRMAIWAGQAGCCERLIGHGSSKVTNEGDSPDLHLVLGRGPDQNGKPGGLSEDRILTTVKVLLALGADPNCRNSNGVTPLKLTEKLPKVRRLLLDEPRLDPALPVENGGDTPIKIAASAGHWKAFERFLKQVEDRNDPNLGGRGNSILHLLAFKGAPEDLVDEYLEKADLEALQVSNQAGLLPVHVALHEKNWGFVKRLLDAGLVKPAWKGEKYLNLIGLALNTGAGEELLQRLVALDGKQLAEPNVMNWTVLHRACGLQMTKWIDALKPVLAEQPELWEIKDAEGRLPGDLLQPGKRENYPDAQSSIPWPEPKSWDSDCEWKAVLDEERDELLELLKIDDKEGTRNVSAETEMDETVLSFYPEGVRMIRLKDREWQPEGLVLYFLVAGGEVTPLAGTSPAIHKLNGGVTAGGDVLRISRETAVDYLKFFCFFVRGEEGPFLVVESADQSEIPKDLDPDKRERIAAVSHPAWLNGRDDENGWFLVTANIYYADAFFAADLRVMDTGMVSMIDEYTLLENLKARIDRPIS